MKKIVLVLVLIMIGVSCKKEDIKPNIEPYIENIEEDVEEDNAHISDSMVRVSIDVKTRFVSVNLRINNDNKDYIVYSVSEDSSVYVTNGWYDYPNGGGRSWTGWIKPESLVTLSGHFTGLDSNVLNFEIIVTINDGPMIIKKFNITPSNKNYITFFLVK